jgi:hypothetical protein
MRPARILRDAVRGYDQITVASPVLVERAQHTLNLIRFPGVECVGVRPASVVSPRDRVGRVGLNESTVPSPQMFDDESPPLVDRPVLVRVRDSSYAPARRRPAGGREPGWIYCVSPRRSAPSATQAQPGQSS